MDRWEYLGPTKVRVLHGALGVDLCSSMWPRRIYSFPPQPYGDPLRHFSSNVTIATPADVVNLRYYVLPLWIPVVGLGVAVVFLMARARRQHYRRKRSGLCQNCGYDLAGNTSGVCPECGIGEGG
ncbi:MAG: hypothetical protein AMXMBFR13_08110 [Phycisphaerae bacterium]